MPKLTDEQLKLKRAAILDAARRCFARYGYEGSTIALLEERTGVSRGAIFNYFDSKEDIFLAIAQIDRETFARTWIELGFENALRRVLEQDPDWMSVYIEFIRRLRTSASFRERLEDPGGEVAHQLDRSLAREQASGRLRSNVSIETLGTFYSLLINGLAVRVASGMPAPALDDVLRLVNEGVRGNS